MFSSGATQFLLRAAKKGVFTGLLCTSAVSAYAIRTQYQSRTQNEIDKHNPNQKHNLLFSNALLRADSNTNINTNTNTNTNTNKLHLNWSLASASASASSWIGGRGRGCGFFHLGGRALCDSYFPSSSASSPHPRKTAATKSLKKPKPKLVPTHATGHNAHAIPKQHDLVDEFFDDMAEEGVDEHFHLASTIEDVKQSVEVNKMLDVFRVMYDSGQEISLHFLIEMFYQSGIEDERVARRLFRIMDRNGDGILQQSEIFAVLCLFAGGDQQKRFRFLFRCLDLDGGGTVDKQEFRDALTAILESRYNLGGLSDPYDADEIFVNVLPTEFHTVAKFKANRIVRDIFLVADTNRDGQLQMKEFLYWCRRGNKEVRLLENALISAVEAIDTVQH